MRVDPARALLAALGSLEPRRLHRHPSSGDSRSARVLVLLEGRDGSGKTTTARDVVEVLGPSRCRVVALAPPSEVERRGFYFERWLAHLPGPGSVILFDRSWYNRALVERVMEFCSPLELAEFFHAVPWIEADLLRRGYEIVKVFFTIGLAEQARRLAERRLRGALSIVDAEAIARRDAYARAEEELFARTSTPTSPWIVLPECDRAERCAAVVEHIRMASQRLRTSTRLSTPPLAR